MSRLQIALLSLFLVLLSVMVTRFGTFPCFNDHHDIWIYSQRGSWATTGQQPYRDVFSEYPQIATWLFAVPHVAVDAWSQLSGASQKGEQSYRYVFSGLMAIFLAGTIAMLHALRRDHKWLAFLLLLPASCYFTHNRFDIVPAFLTLASLAALRRTHLHSAFVLLAIATATKWYALVMMPVFTVYVYQTNRRVLFSAISSYALVLFAIFLPTLLAIGWQGFLIPYKFHLTRTTNSESLLHLVTVTFTRLGIQHTLVETVLMKVFLLLQFAIAPLCAISRIDTWDKVVRWSALSIMCFMLFAKFCSPQWILWIVPLLVLLVRTPSEMAGIVVLDLVIYVYFPYIYYLQDKHPLWFPGIIALKTLMLGIWILHLLRHEDIVITALTRHVTKGGCE